MIVMNIVIGEKVYIVIFNFIAIDHTHNLKILSSSIVAK